MLIIIKQWIYIKKAIDLGNSNAMIAIGEMFEKGEGVEKDFDIALKIL